MIYFGLILLVILICLVYIDSQPYLIMRKIDKKLKRDREEYKRWDRYFRVKEGIEGPYIKDRLKNKL